MYLFRGSRMQAMKIKQKGVEFYFVDYRAKDLLKKVRFQRRFRSGDEEYESKKKDEISEFISKIEKSDSAFQRKLVKRKVREIKEYYESVDDQPLIPSPVLLFTHEHLKFDTHIGETIGDLEEPSEGYIIIDGQHRLAGLKFYIEEHEEQGDNIMVPTIIFDGKQEDYACEMFVIINSTHTRISKSHLIDLYKRHTRLKPEERIAAEVIEYLYEENISPLKYRINMLGGRSKKEKWILQSQLHRELKSLIEKHKE